VTLGIGEPFTTTVGIALLFAFVLALPVLLYQIYSFALPGVQPSKSAVLETVPLYLLFELSLLLAAFAERRAHAADAVEVAGVGTL
jgi:Sec-independent protein secretion pathway component TatC